MIRGIVRGPDVNPESLGDPIAVSALSIERRFMMGRHGHEAGGSMSF